MMKTAGRGKGEGGEGDEGRGLKIIEW